ncbi:platelet glycoprotein IX [Eucyclogobius newberryi]|uniref:platelet glycoprotein IX n=1 Tax=Eucyclogobius newberryi TaxID=166745 RepID=UPI003B5B159F
MIFSLIFGIFLVTTITPLGLPHPCRCIVHPKEGLIVNCSSSELISFPYLPRDITELHLSNTSLSTVPPGLFDKLVGLKQLYIAGNPFHCDCRIQYLRNWLLKNRDIVAKEPTCASPGAVSQRAISELSEEFFSSCSKPSCTNGVYLVMTGTMLLCVIALLAYTLRLAKESTISYNIDERHALFEAHSLRSQKPKHRRKWSLLNKQDPLERPLLNMELLPQVLDTLHKKHNIKIKGT